MFIQPEFQKLLSDYRKFDGQRIYALFDALGPHVQRMVRTRMAAEVLNMPIKKAQKAIERRFYSDYLESRRRDTVGIEELQDRAA